MAPRGRAPPAAAAAAARAQPKEEEDGDDVIVLSSTPTKSEGKKKKINSNKERNGSHNRNNHNNKNGNGNGSGSSSSPPDADDDRSTCVFPTSRVRRLIGGEGGIADDGTRCSHEAVFLINKASEMFLQTFAVDAYANAKRDRKKRLAITYDHLSSIVCNGTRYEFLSDFVPEKIRAEDALKEKAIVEP